jgi:hypothetical protein
VTDHNRSSCETTSLESVLVDGGSFSTTGNLTGGLRVERGDRRTMRAGVNSKRSTNAICRRNMLMAAQVSCRRANFSLLDASGLCLLWSFVDEKLVQGSTDMSLEQPLHQVCRGAVDASKTDFWCDQWELQPTRQCRRENEG